MTAPTRSRGGLGRSVVIGLVLLGVLLTVGALTADRRTGRPYDVASAEPNGIKAMVELVTSFGARVTVPDRLPGSDVDVAIIFEDGSDEVARDELREWVRAGHVLVVADPASELVPEADFDPSSFSSGSSSSVVPRGTCPVEALRGVDEIDPGDGLRYAFVDRGVVPMCFPSGSAASPGAPGVPGSPGAFLSAQAEGDGTIIGLSSPDLFVNENLGKADNAALATTLLAPQPGSRVSVLTDKAFPRSGTSVSGDDALAGLVSTGVKLLALELLVALVVLALASGRRLGRPIDEPQPVQIAGSELVEAVGQLLQQRREPTSAAAVLRADLRRLVVQRFGIAPDVEPTVMAEAIASRTTLERDYVLAVLADQSVGSDAELAALAAHIDRIREEVVHGHAP